MHDLWLPTWGPEVGLSGSPSPKKARPIYKKVDSGVDRQLLLENLGVSFNFELVYPEFIGIPFEEAVSSLRPVMVEVGNAEGNIVSEHREWMRDNRPRSSLAFFPEAEDCRSIQPTLREILEATSMLTLEALMPMNLDSFTRAMQSGNISFFPKLEEGEEVFFPFILERETSLDQVLTMFNGKDGEPIFALDNAINTVQFFRGDTRLLVPCWEDMAA